MLGRWTSPLPSFRLLVVINCFVSEAVSVVPIRPVR
jgi:hypothetical protein